MKNLCLLLLIATLTNGCSEFWDSPSSPSEPAFGNTQSLSNCDTMKAALADPNAVTVPSYTQTMVRQNKRTQRYDCSGNLVSDRPEPINDERFGLTLKNPDGKSFQGVAVIDDKTCDQMVMAMPAYDGFFNLLSKVTGDGQSGIQMKADLAEATFTFHLDVDQNVITVRYFHDCFPQSFPYAPTPVDTGSCAESKDYTTVNYPVDVQYSEVTVDGVQVIRPDAGSCQANH